jgi:hypothetical protein
MKTYTVPGEVHDIKGLFFDLMKAEFEVTRITQEKGMTVIHLEDEEGKSPLGVAELWIDRPYVPPARKVLEERSEAYRAFLAERSARLQALRASARRIDETVRDGFDSEERVLTLDEPVKKEGWFSKLKKLW